MVSSDVGQADLLTFANAQVFKEGYLLQYDVGLPIYAGQNGLVVLLAIQNTQARP